MCDPDVVKNLNVKVFNLISRMNKTRHIAWRETCKCTCRLDANVCDDKQRQNGDKFKCEWKELIDKGVCDKGSIWNPSNCEFECDKPMLMNIQTMKIVSAGKNQLITQLQNVLKILMK